MSETSNEPDGRRRRGNQTRAAVASAATGLFIDRGFAGTTVADIAEAAQVSVQTIYYAFGTKEGVLSAALDASIAGDHEPVPTMQRAWFLEAIAHPEALEQLSIQIGGAAGILRRAAPLLEVLRSASYGNPELSELWAENVRQRRLVQRRLVGALVEKSELRPGVTRAMAVDICALLLGPETYQFMLGSMGWSHRRWLEWTNVALPRELLP